MFCLGFVPLEEAGWTGIEVRLCALLEMERESEDREDDQVEATVQAKVWQEQRESGASGDPRGLPESKRRSR